MLVDRKYIQFLKKMIFFVILGVLCVTLFVIVIDPYRLYGLLDREGFNQVKPGLDRYQEKIKLIGAKRVNSDMIILGNSRAEIGFDPEDKILLKAGLSSYNLAIPGTGIDTARRQLNYLYAANQKPKMFILGVDFLDFLSDPKVNPTTKLALKKALDVDSYKWQFDVGFSLPSVLDSLKTLQIQKNIEAETITSRGFNPLHEYNKYAREQGYHSLFQQRAEENAKNYIRKRDHVILSAPDSRARWSDFRSLLINASENGAELHIVIYPYHAQILLMFEQVGLWPAFEQWKEQLSKEIDSIKILHSEAKIQLWDFSGYSPIQCEAIPSKMDKVAITKWYWEAGHFKSSLGQLMLARMLNQSDDLAVDVIGYSLNSGNLAFNRQRIADEKRRCLSVNSELSANVSHLLEYK